MKIFRRFLFLIVAFSCLFLPQVTNSYDFESKGKEEKVKATRREIYDLYNVYKEVVKSSNNNSSQFGVMNYNGVCNMVTVDGTTIPLEDYVAGVINAEIGCDSRYIEASKAQAIAIRSFLLNTKADSSSCSVQNGQNYQAYRKVDVNSSNGQICMEIINSTAGMVVSRNGEVAHTQYQSYPARNWQTEDSSGWHVQFQRFSNDESTRWTWNGPSRSYVLDNSPGYNTDMGAYNSHNWGMSQTIAKYLAYKENYTYDKIIELFYNEPIVRLTDGVYDADIKYVNSNFGNVVYWNQGDFKKYYFSADPYNSNPYGGTIQSHGCGPTSVAIIVSSFLNKSISPIETTAEVCKLGGCDSGGSYNEVLAKTMREVYGLNVKMTDNDQEVIDALGTNKALVITLVRTGTFTAGDGHYIVLTGVNSNRQVSVADPGSRANTEKKWFSFNTVIEERKAKYIIVTR